ncbi:hypothetical protein CK203_090480 [Vitis vinifera]|uniref:DUF4283 domain-containing protein n=1 Tax=Vitis vinifera TaxID=29760 RepID=A0A438BTS4_VITVI|nr:hypothetical protein CK203_090480 [Vitis vinifera]
MVNLRGGRRWFAVESKSFEILIDEVGGIEFCCRGREDRGWSIVWEEKGRKYNLECRSNGQEDFALFCAGFRGKTFLLNLSRREGADWGVEYIGREVEKRNKVWLELGQRVKPERLEQLDRCLVVKPSVFLKRDEKGERQCLILEKMAPGVDDKTDIMAEMQWARLLVKVVGGAGGGVNRKGVSGERKMQGVAHRGGCRGRVLEKEAQSKEQVGVQFEPPCGSSSKDATGFSSDSAERGFGLEATDGADSIGSRGHALAQFRSGLGRRVLSQPLRKPRSWRDLKELGLDPFLRSRRWGSRGTSRGEDAGVVCFLGGDRRATEVFPTSARAPLIDEVLRAEASRYDPIPRSLGGTRLLSSILLLEGEKSIVDKRRLMRKCKIGRILVETKMSEMSLGVVRSLGVGRFLEWGALNARGAAGGVVVYWDRGLFIWSGGLNNQAMSRLDHSCVGDWEAILMELYRVLFLGQCQITFPFFWMGRGEEGACPFPFENMWLKEEGFKDLLKGCGKEKMRTLSLEELEARKEAKGDFEKWTLMEEISWRQKSREIRLMVLVNRRAGYQGGCGWSFREPANRSWDWHPSMEGLDFIGLMVRMQLVWKGFTEAESSPPLRSERDKAPGPDGFSLSFWQFSWDFVKDEVMGL